ncbi:hypothetical protein EMCRGX_G026440 [Ephydatia muelleri]
MVATALREIPSILSDVMVTATTFRSILAQFGRCHELYDGNYINEYNASQLAAAIPSFMESFRRAFPKATTPIKMHLLEDHALQWANRMHVGFGLLGEQGAESIHANTGEAFAAIGYMWKSWSGHPHLNAEPAQCQGYVTHLQATHTAWPKDTQSDVEPRYNPIMPEVNNLFNQIRTANQRSSSKLLTTRRERKGKESHLSFQVVTHNLSADVAHLSSPARETPDALSHLEKRTDDSPPLMMLLTVCISAHLVFTVLEQAAVVGCQAFISSKRWCAFMAFIATSLHISVAYHTLYQYQGAVLRAARTHQV